MEEKKKYDREFLLGFQFISASMNRPEGLPAISDVVLDKVRTIDLLFYVSHTFYFSLQKVSVLYINYEEFLLVKSKRSLIKSDFTQA